MIPAPLRRVPRALWLALGGLALAGILLLATVPPDEPAAPAVQPAAILPPPPAPAAPTPPTAAGLALVGILPGGIVVSDGGFQRRVGLGREVRPGLVLVRVDRGRAILRSGPDEIALALPATSPSPAPAAPRAAGPLPAPGADTRAIDSELALALSPERGPGGDIAGWRVGAPPPILAAAGVRAGDLLVTVNGRALLSPADIAGLGREAAVSATLVLGVTRAGKPLELRLER